MQREGRRARSARARSAPLVATSPRPAIPSLWKYYAACSGATELGRRPKIPSYST